MAIDPTAARDAAKAKRDEKIEEVVGGQILSLTELGDKAMDGDPQAINAILNPQRSNERPARADGNTEAPAPARRRRRRSDEGTPAPAAGTRRRTSSNPLRKGRRRKS